MREYAIILSGTTQEDRAKLATYLKTHNEIIDHEPGLIRGPGLCLAYDFLNTKWSRYGFLPRDKILITINEFLKKSTENRLEQALTEAKHYEATFLPHLGRSIIFPSGIYIIDVKVFIPHQSKDLLC